MDILKQMAITALYPELRSYPQADRARLLKEAAQEPFDGLEWVGILAALVIAMGLTRYSVIGLTPGQQFVAVLVNFLVTIALVGVLAAPFLVRRKKRGLSKRLPRPPGEGPPGR
jgi:hypothetical protein